MKDIIITPKHRKKELMWLAASLLGAILINVFSIILYKTNWSELYTQILWVLLFSCVLYVISVGIRLCIFLLKKMF